MSTNSNQIGPSFTNALHICMYRSSIGWLFWGIIITFVIPNIYGFVLPLLGLGRNYLVWNRIPNLVGLMMILHSIFGLTATVGLIQKRHYIGSKIVRLSIVVVICTEVVVLLMPTLLPTLIRISGGVGEDLCTIILIFFLGQICRYASLQKLRKRFHGLYIAFAIALAFTWLSYFFSLVPGRWNLLSALLQMLLVIFELVWIRLLYQRLSWASSGCCIQCAYDLRGNVTGVCSECGSKIEAKS